MTAPKRPTREELLASSGKSVADLLAPGLRVLFCGINPGLYSGAVGHHFARPGNRFWPVLHTAGFTNRELKPEEEEKLLDWGVGITNLVNRATASASEVSRSELIAGRDTLEEKARRLKPFVLAVLGIGAFRSAFQLPRTKLGQQEMTLGDTLLWVLPNPSGINAHYQLKDLTLLYRQLNDFVNSDRASYANP
jgi:TDG/mug DNA glycosylase family protein